MPSRYALLAILAIAVAAPHTDPALANIPPEVRSGIEAAGYVDLDGSGPYFPYSEMSDAEFATPFTRSFVRVSDAPGYLYYYDAVADIGAGALKLTAVLANYNRSESFFAQGEPLMQVSAHAKDVLTLHSALPGSFQVTLQLAVTGNILTASSIIPGSTRATGNALLSFGAEAGPDTVVTRQLLPGDINELLSVTQTVTGPIVNVDFETLLNFEVTAVGPDGGAEAHLGNSALLRLLVPAGVSVIASESQAFFAPITVVSEPDNYAFMLTGVGLVGIAVARRRKIAGTRSAWAYRRTEGEPIFDEARAPTGR